MIQRFNRSFILLGAIIACFAAIQTVALAQEMNQCDVLFNEDGVPIDEEGFVSTVILGTDDINDRLNDDSTDDEFHMMNQCEDLIGEIEIYFANIDAECELECIRDEMAYEGSRHLS